VFEVLHFWQLLTDAELNTAAAAALLRAAGGEGGVDLAADGRLAGLYMLQGHPDRNIRRLVRPRLGPCCRGGPVHASLLLLVLCCAVDTGNASRTPAAGVLS
jgi:hypothetical protein